MDKNQFLKEIRNHTSSHEILCDFIDKNSKKFNDDENFLIEFVNVCSIFIYLIQKEQITENVFAAALNRNAANVFDDESLPSIFNRQQSMLLDEEFLINNKSMFTRDLYLKCKDSILKDAGKIHKYLRMFYSLLNDDDTLEIYNICIDSSNEILGEYTKSFLLVKLAEHKLLSNEQLSHIISTGVLKYKRLDVSSRNIVAAEAIEYSHYNLKYLSVDNKLKFEKNIDYKKEPMLTGYIENKSMLSSCEWVEIAKLDQRAMRFLPSYILSDHSIMSDDFLIQMIKQQNRYRLYAKIIPFINQISPERLTLNFCKTLKDYELSEYNHPIIQKIIKSHEIGSEKVYNLKIKKNIFKLNKQQMLNLKQQINLKLS
jgi:hypothetical protein